MKTIQIRHSRGFTLVELLVAMAIMGIMISTSLMIYLNVWNTSLRMEMSRELAETARQITERIAQDVREEGIMTENVEDIGIGNVNFDANAYKNGVKTLGIGKKTSSTIPEWQYIYGKLGNAGGFSQCGDTDKNNPGTHCGLYIWKDGKYINLVDSFTPEEDKKRVKITDLKFYVSGDENSSKKVTLKMTLELTRRSGVPASLVRATKLEVQSTFSDSIFTH